MTLLDLRQRSETLGGFFKYRFKLRCVLSAFGNLFVEFSDRCLVAFLDCKVAKGGIHLCVFMRLAPNGDLQRFGGCHLALWIK